MNKNDLISQVADDSGLSKVDATKAVDSVLDNIAGALGNGGEVRLVGFGTFSVRTAKQQPAATHVRAKRFKLKLRTSLNSKLVKR